VEPSKADDLSRLDRNKRVDGEFASPLGGELIDFYQRQVEKRKSKLGKISEAWDALVPQQLQERSCLEGFHRGRLTVIVDSAAHLYQLKQMLLAGLEKQLCNACKGAGLRKVAVKRGRWYDEDGRADF
jgi:hypothetical protein